LSAFVLVLSAILLHAMPARAAGTVHARIYLTNETPNPVTVTGTHVDGDWEYPGAQGPGYTAVSNPQGATIAPNTTLVWGSVRHDSFFETDGTGGSVTLLVGGDNWTTTWSSPWSMFNGLGGSCSGSASEQSAGPSTFSAANPDSVLGGASGSTDNSLSTCAFTYGVVQTEGVLRTNQRLVAGQKMLSNDGRFTFTMQTDGNLVMYYGTTPLWASNTYLSPGVVVIMQTDGNLVIYDTNHSPVWATSWEPGFVFVPGAVLAIQNDGNLVIYASPTSGAVDWTSWSCCACGWGGITC
jgi:hypothetical protein